MPEVRELTAACIVRDWAASDTRKRWNRSRTRSIAENAGKFPISF